MSRCLPRLLDGISFKSPKNGAELLKEDVDPFHLFTHFVGYLTYLIFVMLGFSQNYQHAVEQFRFVLILLQEIWKRLSHLPV